MRVVLSGSFCAHIQRLHPLNRRSGVLIDGTEFDSNLKKGTPVEIKPTEVVPGWSEALLLMREGDKWEVTIPSGKPCNWHIMHGESCLACL